MVGGCVSLGMYLECKYISHEELQLDITSFEFLAFMSIVTDRMKTSFHYTKHVPWHPSGPGSIYSIWLDMNYCPVCFGTEKTTCLLITRRKPNKMSRKGKFHLRFVYSFFTVYPQLNHFKKNGGKESFEVIKWVLQLNHKSGTNIIFHVAIRTHCPNTLVQVLFCSVLGGTISLTLQACSS